MELGLGKDFDLDQEAKTREQAIFVVVLLLLLVVALRLLWMPVMSKIKEKNQEISAVKKQVEALEKFINLDKKIAPAQESLGTDKKVTFIEDVLRETAKNPQQTIAQAMREVTSKKRLGNLVLNNISFEQPQDKGGYYIVPIKMNLSGTYSALQSYFAGIEKIDFLYTVDNISFKVSENNPGIIISDLSTSLYIGGAAGLVPEADKTEKKKTGGAK